MTHLPAVPCSSAGTKATALGYLRGAQPRGGQRAAPSHLYALLDTARDPAIYEGLRQFAAVEDIACLYQGPSSAELVHVSPYLVMLRPGSEMFDWLWNRGWGQSWGVFVRSAESLDSLRRHFRKLTKVQTETGQMLLFRFYDPRVLSIFLPICTAPQMEKMFGPVETFLIEAAEGAALEEFTWLAPRLQRQLLSLVAGGHGC